MKELIERIKDDLLELDSASRLDMLHDIGYFLQSVAHLKKVESVEQAEEEMNKLLMQANRIKNVMRK